MRPRAIHSHERNALYLLSALCMVFMTLVVAIQPLFLRNVLNISFSTAGAINANVQVVTEVLDLFVFAYMGYLSDRLGRVRIIVAGFLVAAAGAVIAPFSPLVGGTGALVVYYLSRVIMSLGTGAVWPQLSALAGDFSDAGNRARLMSNTALMMAFGVTLVYAVLMQIPRHLGITGTMLMTAGIAGVAAWLSRDFLVDVAPRTSESSIPWHRIWLLVKDEPRLRLAFASSFFARSDMVFVGLFLMLWFIYFADLVKTGQAEAAAHAGLLIGMMGAVVMLSIPAWRAFIERFGRIRAIILGMSLSSAGFISLGLIVNPFSASIILPVLLFSAGQAGCFIAPQILTVDHAPKELLGSVLGVFNVLGGIGIIFFVQIGGFLFDYVGPPAPFVFTGVGSLIITIFAVRILKEERRLSGLPDMPGVEEVE